MRLIRRKEEKKDWITFNIQQKRENLWKPFLLTFFSSIIHNIHDFFAHFPFFVCFQSKWKIFSNWKLSSLLEDFLLELSKTHWIIRSGWVASSFSWSRDILTYSILRCVGVLHESTAVRVTVWTICYEMGVRFASLYPVICQSECWKIFLILGCYLSEQMFYNSQIPRDDDQRRRATNEQLFSSQFSINFWFSFSLSMLSFFHLITHSRTMNFLDAWSRSWPPINLQWWKKSLNQNKH